MEVGSNEISAQVVRGAEKRIRSRWVNSDDLGACLKGIDSADPRTVTHLKTEVSFELSGRELREGNEPGRSKWLASALVILLTFALCHLTWRVMEMRPRPRLLQQEEKISFPLRAEACDSRWFVFGFRVEL
jgi:hypothetical protein